jgi:ATP-binding cassette subfamily B protein
MKKPRPTLTQVHREEKEADSKPLSFDLIRRLFTHTKPFARKRNLLLLVVCVRAIQLPALAWAIGAVLGGPVSRLDVRGILMGAAGYGLLALLTQWTMLYRTRLALELGEDVILDMRNRLFSHLQTLPMSFHNRTRLGRIISRFTSDAEAVRVGVQDVLFVTMVQGGQMLIAAILMIHYDPVLFLVVMAIAPVVLVINLHFRKRLSTAYRSVQESFSRVTATLVETVGGIRVTQGFVRQDLNASLFRDLMADHYQYNLESARASGVFLPLLEINIQIFLSLVLLVGGWRTLHGMTEVQDLYQFILMANLFFGPIQSLSGMYNQALSAMAGAERVFKLLDTQPEWTDPPDAIRLEDVKGRVEFRNVTFGYDPARPVLHDVSFIAEPGQTVALVGPTGSGKSSMINLIAKFYLPTQGEILVDGMEIRQIFAESLRRRMGIVLQQNFLFTGTVLENIRLGRPDATDEEAIGAARQLDCVDLIEALPQGFQTQVGERGSSISLGQRQLICFARAMLADPRILILDEATSAVDTVTESRIQKALVMLVKNRTSFVVAHRLSTVRHADVVLVLDDGRIVERGSHPDLLAANGMYADLYRQFIRIAES